MVINAEGYPSEDEAAAARVFDEQQKQLTPVEQKMAQHDAAVGLPESDAQNKTRETIQASYKQEEESGQSILQDPERKKAFDAKIKNFYNDINSINSVAELLQVKDQTDELVYPARSRLESAQNNYRPVDIAEAQRLLDKTVNILVGAEDKVKFQLELLRMHTRP